ncbi:hypothetical protein VTO73DRAFT_15537 [Trametes versicolor]
MASALARTRCSKRTKQKQSSRKPLVQSSRPASPRPHSRRTPHPAVAATSHRRQFSCAATAFTLLRQASTRLRVPAGGRQACRESQRSRQMGVGAIAACGGGAWVGPGVLGSPAPELEPVAGQGQGENRERGGGWVRV